MVPVTQHTCSLSMWRGGQITCTKNSLRAELFQRHEGNSSNADPNIGRGPAKTFQRPFSEHQNGFYDSRYGACAILPGYIKRRPHTYIRTSKTNTISSFSSHTAMVTSDCWHGGSLVLHSVCSGRWPSVWKKLSDHCMLLKTCIIDSLMCW